MSKINPGFKRIKSKKELNIFYKFSLYMLKLMTDNFMVEKLKNKLKMK